MNLWKRFPLAAVLATILAAVLFFPAEAMAATPNPQMLKGEYISVNQSTFSQQTTLCIDEVKWDEDSNCQLGNEQCQFSGTLKTTPTDAGQYMTVEGKLYSFNIKDLIAITFQAYHSDLTYSDVYEAWAGLTNGEYKILDMIGSRVEINKGTGGGKETGSICPMAGLFVKTNSSCSSD